MKLTQKQQAIIDLIANNLSNRQIAETLDISMAAVEHHVYRLRLRAGVQHRGDLVQFANTPMSVGTTTTRLSEREISILALLARRMRTREIADQLGLKDVSVRAYISNVLCRTNCHSREELVSWAIDKCIVEAEEPIHGEKQQRRIRKTQQQSRIEREQQLYDEVAARLGFYRRGER